jgi:hypothetical protein
MQLTPLAAYGLNILAFAYHIVESINNDVLVSGDHVFFISFWAVYCWSAIMSVATFYPGA